MTSNGRSIASETYMKNSTTDVYCSNDIIQHEYEQGSKNNIHATFCCIDRLSEQCFARRRTMYCINAYHRPPHTHTFPWEVGRHKKKHNYVYHCFVFGSDEYKLQQRCLCLITIHKRYCKVKSIRLSFNLVLCYQFVLSKNNVAKYLIVSKSSG
jgi:hypothetical protein